MSYLEGDISQPLALESGIVPNTRLALSPVFSEWFDDLEQKSNDTFNPYDPVVMQCIYVASVISSTWVAVEQSRSNAPTSTLESALTSAMELVSDEDRVDASDWRLGRNIVDAAKLWQNQYPHSHAADIVARLGMHAPLGTNMLLLAEMYREFEREHNLPTDDTIFVPDLDS